MREGEDPSDRTDDTVIEQAQDVWPKWFECPGFTFFGSHATRWDARAGLFAVRPCGLDDKSLAIGDATSKPRRPHSIALGLQI